MHTSPNPVTSSHVFRWFRSHLITRDLARKNWLHARRTLQIDRIKLVFSETLIQASVNRRLSKSEDEEPMGEYLSPAVKLHRQRVNEWSQTFDRVVESDEARSVFFKFLESEYSEENILFWTAVEELHSLTDGPSVGRAVGEIYHTFVEVDSPLSINIDHETRQAIKMKIKDSEDLCEIEMGIFDRAQMQIYRLMEKDCFGRFVQTESYKQLASRMGLPTTLRWGGAGGRSSPS